MKRREKEAFLLERARRSAAVRGGIAATVKPLHAAVCGGSTRGPAPKPRAYRDPALLEMARGRHCLLRVPGMCVGAGETTVAAHSNLLSHGKSKGRKADDCYSAFACFPCHYWLDQGSASAEDKEAVFMAAHVRQVFAWRQIAADAGEPERFRRAALRALERLNATPLGDSP